VVCFFCKAHADAALGCGTRCRRRQPAVCVHRARRDKKKLTPREQKKSKGGIAVALEPSIVSAVAVLRDTKDKAQVQKVLQKWAARGHFSSHVARALGNAAAMKLDVPADSSAMSSSMTMAASSAARSKEAADKIILDMSSFSSAPAPSSAPPPPPPPPSSLLPSAPVRTWGASSSSAPPPQPRPPYPDISSAPGAPARSWTGSSSSYAPPPVSAPPPAPLAQGNAVKSWGQRRGVPLTVQQPMAPDYNKRHHQG